MDRKFDRGSNYCECFRRFAAEEESETIFEFSRERGGVCEYMGRCFMVLLVGKYYSDMFKGPLEFQTQFDHGN